MIIILPNMTTIQHTTKNVLTRSPEVKSLRYKINNSKYCDMESTHLMLHGKGIREEENKEPMNSGCGENRTYIGH